MLLNIGLTVALAPTFGLAGILAGTIIGSSIGSIYFIVLFHRRFGFSWFQTMGNWLFRLVATTVLACLGLHFLQAWVSAGWSASRWAGLILLSMYGIAYLICFAIGGILFGFWSDNDIEVSRRLMLKIAHSRRR
jgi:peptidoglycan biosynthesis protein MviN/MurJ (putative lipid II flippase)